MVTIVAGEYLSRRPKTLAILEEFTGLKAIGQINRLKAKHSELSILHSSSNSNDINLLRENLRKIRYELETTNAGIILFSSLRPGEGKSFLIHSLAYSLNLNLKKVLLIDTNFKNNSLTRWHSAKPALEKYLRGGDINPNTLISGTGYKGIDILGCEGGRYSPSEIFSQIDFPDLLHKLSDKYHYIFMEAPPMLKFSDTKELLQYADKVVPVFSAELNLDHADQETLEYLQSLDKKVLGAILNKVAPQDM